MKRTAVIISVLSVFIAGLWFIAIPQSLIADFMENSLNGDNIYLHSEGLKKGLFYNFSAERILLKRKGINRDSDVPLFIFNDVNGRFDLMSLFRLSPEGSFDCKIGNGVVKGRVGLTGKRNLMIRGNNIPINGIPFFESLGIYGEGILAVSFLANNKEGGLKFSVNDARLKSTFLGGVFLPLNLFHDIKGVIKINDGTADVQSLALSGRGVYGRVRGIIKGNHLDMNLELMTDSSFATGPVFQALVEQYKVSPNYYVIPFKSEISYTKGE